MKKLLVALSVCLPITAFANVTALIDGPETLIHSGNINGGTITQNPAGNDQEVTPNYQSRFKAERRYIQGLNEPRLALAQDGNPVDFNLTYPSYNKVAWYQKLHNPLGGYTCAGIQRGTLTWAADDGQYAILQKDNPNSDFPSYDCPIWVWR